MSLRIDRLDIRMGSDRAQARAFAEALTRELSRTGVATGALRLDRLTLPPIPARRGEHPSVLARRTAAAILDAVNRQGRGS